MVFIEVDNEQDACSLKESKGLDVNEKSDSGMDDDSVKTDSPVKANLDSDSEDEIIVTKKQKRKVILEDSDEDEDEKSKEDDNDDAPMPVEEKFVKNKSAEDVLNEVMNDDENSEQEADNNEEKSESQDSKLTEPPKPMFSDKDIYDAEESSDEEKDEKKKKKVSDANNSDDSDSNESDSNDEEREEPGDDEGFDESTIDPELLAKLKKFKGAGKTATREGKKRKAKENALNIHSESQRLVRESHINLPYHQPTPKSLNDFLARASKKQEQYKCLRSVRDTKNAKVIVETLSEKKDRSTKEVTASKETKNSSSDDKDEPKKDLNNESSRTYLFDTLCSLKNTENESEDELPDITPRDLNQDFSNAEKVDGDTEMTSGNDEKNPEEVSQMETETNLETDVLKDSEISAKAQNDFEYSSMCLDDDSEKCYKDQTLDLESEKLSDLKSSDTLDSTQTPKQKILSRLNLSIEEKPKLSGAPDDFISFENESNTPKNPELNKFMDRFLKHSKKKQHKKPKDVDISIIQKESTSDNKEELKLNSFTYHIDEEEDTVSKGGEDIPGAKLLTLKEKLEAAMKIKREVSRQKREEMYNLENEEGFEEGADNLLDNEEELTDGSDTDIEDDDFDKQFGEEEYDDEEQEKVENPFADDEADEEEDGEKEDAEDEEETMKLQLETSDEEDDEIKKPSKSQRVVISDDEESQDTVQNNTDKGCDEEMDINNDEDELSPLSKHLKSNTPKLSRIGNLTLAIEDTQDLYNDTQDGFHSANYPVSDTQPSQSLNYLLEDSQSQMLDADGFLKVRSTQPTRRSLGLEDFPNQTQDNMDELLGLCSGRFVENSNTDKKKSLFDNDVSSQGGDMDELVGLCSGVFATAKSQGTKRKLDDDDDDLDESTNLLLSEDESTQKLEDNESSSDDETPNIIIKQKKKKGFKTRDGKIRQDFVDEEAELSGSEYDSDENLDIDDDEDILMEEEGDKDNAVSETELRDQVGRAHLKQVIDEDKREIVRLKEMYLPDGDLHSDSAGRMRRFRWSNIDEGSQQDIFGNDSDGGEEGGDENEAAEELKWRMERHEREKFLEEQKENEEKEANEKEDSQILKFGKCFLQKKDPNKTTLQRSVSLPITTNQSETDSTFIKPSLKSSKRGSFLNRSKAALAKIADRTKSKMNPNQTAHSRNFVFQVISPDKNKAEPQVTVTKATPSLKVKKPPNKRQKLDTKKNTKSHNSSIFKLLEN